VDDAIHQQINYFSSLGHSFELKAYAHDAPADLVSRLAALGFEIDEREAVKVLDLESFSVPPFDLERSAEFRILMIFAWSSPSSSRCTARAPTTCSLNWPSSSNLLPATFSVYVACVGDNLPAATAWIRFPSAAPSPACGVVQLPEARQRGLYTALLWTRVDEARRCGYRYVTVDARAMSRPILEKRGFHVLTYATACTWHG